MTAVAQGPEVARPAARTVWDVAEPCLAAAAFAVLCVVVLKAAPYLPEPDDNAYRASIVAMASIRAVLPVAVSHLVSGRAGGPWRLYYTRYYTGAAVSTSGPAGTPIRLVTKCHLAPRT